MRVALVLTAGILPLLPNLVLSQAIGPAANEKVLARPEFRQEMTIDLKDAPVSELFDVISEASGTRFFVDSNVTARTTTHRRGPINEILRSLATKHDLVYEESGGSAIRVRQVKKGP